MIIYKTTNLINGKIYIGKLVRFRPGYFGTGKWITRALKKYGRQCFKREILEECKTHEELCEKEIFYIDYYGATDPKIGYNIHIGGEGAMHGQHHSEESKRKISEYQRNRIVSNETKIRMSIAQKGLIKSNETINRLKSSYRLSEKRIKNSSEYHYNKWLNKKSNEINENEEKELAKVF